MVEKIVNRMRTSGSLEIPPGLGVRQSAAAFFGSVKSAACWSFILALLGCLSTVAAEVIPPAPEFFFNDYAHVVSSATANQLNHSLADFERQTSSQIWVAIYPKMQSDSSIEDYTVRVARAWKTGQKIKNNGAVLFVFTQDHKLYVQVGYGLEGALPDALCKQIIDSEITPHLKQGDFDGGMRAGVTALMAAAKGEYKGTGRTVAQSQRQNNDTGVALFRLVALVVILGFIILGALSNRRRRYSGGGWWIGGGGFGGGNWGGGSWGGGSSGGGWSGGGSDDRASGGGGSFGGGGAGGSW